MWVDKYKPTQLKQIIGQTGDKSNAKKLLHWLTNWHKSRAAGVKPQGECSCMSGHEVKNILIVGSRSGGFISIVTDIGSTLPRLYVLVGFILFELYVAGYQTDKQKLINNLMYIFVDHHSN